MPFKIKMLIAGLAGLLTAALVGGLALASTAKTLKTASNATIGKTIVVDGHGLTVYELRPETSRHLLCTKAGNCFSAWPPLTVKKNAKLTKASGVPGKLGVLHRNGLYQVTLGGRPLYHFAGDSAKGDANGQGIKSFGGTWHVVTAGAATSGGATTNTTTTSTGYTYPPY